MQSACTFHYQTDQRLAKEAEVAGDMDESLMLREEVKDSDVQKCDQVTRRVSGIFKNMSADEISIQSTGLTPEDSEDFRLMFCLIG